jgi:hypothetical protein
MHDGGSSALFRSGVIRHIIKVIPDIQDTCSLLRAIQWLKVFLARETEGL